jgi:sirohydrochlorin cobaltochelatase
LREDLAKNASKKVVRIACLQFCSPDLLEVISGLSEEGVESVLIVPVFISGQGHVLKDVPEAVKAASERCPGMDIRVTEALGEFPEVARAFRDALLSLLR